VRVAVVTREMAETTTRVQALQAAIDRARPALEARMVEAYKLGRPGYLRLLLGVDEVKDVARASRLVAAMAQRDQRQVADYTAALARLDIARASLGRQAGELKLLQAQAREASAQADRAAAARASLVRQIDERRDFNARMTAELEGARDRLTKSFASLTVTSAGDPTMLPLAPFRGALDWPAAGRVISRFGQQRDRRFGTTTEKNGVELATAEAAPVTAIHEGRVAFAGPFTGFGQLVIVDHGRLAYSLYGYLSTLAVIKGARVRGGQALGVAGRAPAGNSALYFELRIDGKPVDPLQWLKAK
jgi:septal ring factor EnvC (AmiA/AmiB activator)